MSILTDIGIKVGVEFKSDRTRLDTLEANQIVSSTISGFKNKIINGNFDVWQRSESFDQTSDSWSYTTADRYYSNRCKIDKGLDTINGVTVNTMIVSDPNGYNGGRGIIQRIEDYTAFQEICTFSVWIKASSTSNISIANMDDGGATFSGQSITVTSAWQKFTVTLPAQALTSWANMYIIKNLEDGVTYTIAKVQLEKGSIATDFEQRPYGLELSLCQRYYWQYINLVTYAIYASAEYAGNNWRITIPHPETMRIEPTVTINTTLGTPNTVAPTIYGTSLYHTSTYRMESTAHYIKCDAEI